MCILSVYTMLKLVGYYDLSVLSMSVMGFQQKKFGWGRWVGCDLSKLFLSFLTLKSPLVYVCKHCSILRTHAEVGLSTTPYYMYNIYHPFEFSASCSVTSDRLTELLTDEESLDVTPPLG